MQIKKLAVVVGCAALLCGCTQSNIVQPETYGPDFEMYFDIVVDPEQIQEDVNDIFLDPKDYPMGVKIDVSYDLDAEHVDVTVVVKDDTTPEAAAEYTMEVLKGVNDQFAVQDFTYGESGEDTYGGLYQDNVANVKIYRESEYEAGGEPIYDHQIPKDTYEEIVINE
ncbi:MAG: hypothetical protein ACRDBO_02935 [Lachnospiraceae bacterium]